MASIGQYLKETQAELKHVAWPTQLQTIVYTILVALISIAIAFYLGLFDFLFTSALTRVVNVLPQSALTATPDIQIATTTPTNTTPASTATSSQ